MFWENYVALCSKKGVAPNAVAAKLGKSSGSVTAWKNGTVPRETTLKKIADYFEVSVDALLYGQKEKSPASSDTELQNEFMQLFNKLSVEEQVRELAYLRERIAAQDK